MRVASLWIVKFLDQKTSFPLQIEGSCWAASCRPTSPASRPKKEPRVSSRDINGLMDEGAYMSEARSWSDDGQNMVTVFAPGRGAGRGDYQLQGN